MSVEIKGMERLNKALAAYPAAFTQAMEKPLTAAAAIQAAIAKSLVPRDTGELAEGIKVEPAHSTAHHVVAAVKSTAEHGPFIEFGTSNMDAQPFMRPSRDNSKTKVFRFLKNAATKIVPQVARKVR